MPELTAQKNDTSDTIQLSNLHYIVNSIVLLAKVHSAKERIMFVSSF